MRNTFKSNSSEIINKENGFTLIELLIVIVVLGILMSMAVPALSGVKNKADTAVAKADLHNIMQSLEMYYFDHGKYPVLTGEGDFSSVSDKLTELSIKNKAENYDYTTDGDTDSGAEKYIISYTTATDEVYYISTDQSSLIGPVETVPEI